jgi:hypothetical protein
MNGLTLRVPNSQPTIMYLGDLTNRRLVGLDAFLSKPIRIKDMATEMPESYTNSEGTGATSNCSHYCPTSTCGACC